MLESEKGPRQRDCRELYSQAEITGCADRTHGIIHITPWPYQTNKAVCALMMYMPCVCAERFCGCGHSLPFYQFIVLLKGAKRSRVPGSLMFVSCDCIWVIGKAMGH